jgi:hypothetical protein
MEQKDDGPVGLQVTERLTGASLPHDEVPAILPGTADMRARPTTRNEDDEGHELTPR